MEWISCTIVVFLISTLHAVTTHVYMEEEQEGMPFMETDASNTHGRHAFKDEGESQVLCGLRPKRMSARRLDTVQFEDYEESDTHRYDKILGGSFAAPGEFPWQANLRLLKPSKVRVKYKPECGGAILNSYWILSAAHCFVGKSPSSFRVTVGDHDVTQEDEGEQEFNISKIIIHENFNKAKYDYDIALVKIQPGRNGRGIHFNSVVQPICLPTRADNPRSGTDIMVAGWGRSRLSGMLSPRILKKTVLPLLNQTLCRILFQDKMTPRMFCAGYIYGDNDVCGGDSGGPGTYSFADVYILHGLISFGTGCRSPNYPSVFVKVRMFLDWIYRNIKQHSYSQTERGLPSRPVSSH
ncbi:hypothetical protein BsWGS_19412 [Bradybaena similaris]